MALWDQIIERTEYAISCGALLSLPTELRHVEDCGIRFAVRLLGNIPVKTEQARKQDPDFDPFLPYDPDLYVTDLGDSHVCLLNKFNVVDHHILIVTRDFEEQEAPLNLADLRALRACLEEIDGVAFYNSGRAAGASQRHKHLQLAPMKELPIESVIESAEQVGAFYKLPQFDFPHSFYPRPSGSAEGGYKLYLGMLDELKLNPQKSLPYNFLMTRRWVMMVPRKLERWNEIAVNALGFSGTLLVRNEERLGRIIQYGPTEILRRVVAGDEILKE